MVPAELQEILGSRCACLLLCYMSEVYLHLTAVLMGPGGIEKPRQHAGAEGAQIASGVH